MTTYYVQGITGVDTNAGTSWGSGNSCKTVTGALGKATPTLIYVDSAETYTANAGIAWTLPAGNIAIICVNSGTGAWGTGASEAIGTANTSFNIYANAAGSNLFMHGMTIVASTTNSSANDITFNNTSVGPLNVRAQSCTFTLSSGTSAVANLNLGSVGSAGRPACVYFTDCTIRCQNSTTGSVINVASSLVRFNKVTIAMAVGGNKPLTLFSGVASPNTNPDVMVSNSDLSAFDVSGNGLVDAAIGGGVGRYVFTNCKLSSNTSPKLNTFVASGDMTITIINSDDADTIYQFEHYSRAGTLTTDIANYFTTGGASFNSVPVSWKIVTTGVCDEHSPFVTPSLYRWNTSTASTDFNVQSIWDSATNYKTSEVWLGVSYAGSASFPTGAFETDRHATPIESAGSDQDNGTSESWTTSGITYKNEQQLKVTATPAEVGLVEGNVYIAKATATIWIDPLLRVALP